MLRKSHDHGLTRSRADNHHQKLEVNQIRIYPPRGRYETKSKKLSFGRVATFNLEFAVKRGYVCLGSRPAKTVH